MENRVELTMEDKYEMDENYGIVENLTKEQLEEYFAENREIKIKNLSLGVMEWGDGTFDVLLPSDNEQGYEVMNEAQFTDPRYAINFAIKSILEYQEKHENDGSEKGTAPAKKKTSSAKKKSEDVEPEYDGPRVIKVFGREMYTETDPKLKWNDIRKKIVEQGFPNFKKDKVYYDFDEASGVLEIGLKFKTKG